MPFQSAVGTSLAISMATTIAASIALIASGKMGIHATSLIHWPAVVAITFGSALAIKSGAYLGRVLPMALVRNLLVVMLLLSAMQLLSRAFA